MCGILGAVNFEFDNTLLDQIKHRGPDYGKIEKYTIGEDSVIFGHRRLSIIDLSESGNQPMNSICNNYSIIFNGEIYNHKELRNELDNFSFNGHSDTETILYYLVNNLYDKIENLNGLFAFGLLDKEKGKIFLVRDRFGIKPLYYYQEDKQLIFSSEIRPIKSCVESKLERSNLAELLRLRYNPAPDTLYNNIYKLRPGHILEYTISSHTSKITSYLKNININYNIPIHKAIDEYGVLFENAVKKNLLSDVEVGVLLSEGIDSALVAYFAQKHSSNKLKSFTVGFEDEDDTNELSNAKISSEILGTYHHEIRINEDDAISIFKDIARIVEEPLGTTSSIPMYFLNNEVSKHLKVVLTGQGADEPLGGYTRYKGEIYRKKVPSFLFNILKTNSYFIKNESFRRAINSLGERNTIERFTKTYELFTQNEIYNLIKHRDIKSYNRVNYYYSLLNGNSKEPIDAMMSIDTHLNLADDLLLYTDKISMNFGIETRVPFLDNDLMNFLESLTYKFKIKGGQTKYIHKEFAKTILPKEIIYRKKKGFQSPTNKWFKNELGAYFKSIILNDKSLFSEIFDKEQIIYFFDLHNQGYNKEKQLFTLMSIYYWFQELK